MPNSAQKETIKVIDLLVEQNFIDAETATEAKEKGGKDGPVAYLIERGKITKNLVGQAIAEYYKLPYGYLDIGQVDKSVLGQVPQQLAYEMRAIALEVTEEQAIIVTDSPHKVELINEVLAEIFPDRKIVFKYALPDEIDEALRAYQSSITEKIEEILKEKQGFASKIFTAMVEESIAQNVSDIHMEPADEYVKIRFRIDGSLVEITRIEKDIYANLINHIKILAKLRIDKHYNPQDGAIRFKTKIGNVDLRVSLVPLLEGEKTVIRILSNYARQLSLSELGLSEVSRRLVSKASKLTYGMILTTGPTGSGKTTTLYSILRILNTPETNITTIEDPVEYRVEGVNQIQVNRDNDITFASGLRSIVRQDPNIILVGEIRDQETVEIAVNASLTGHLLLSSFHANDAASTIPRILEMGTEPFLLASTLKLIIAQRLVRRTCPYCKVSHEYDKHELSELVHDYKKFFEHDSARLYRGKGCDRCNGTGFLGRVGIFELIYVTEAIQDLILKRSSAKEIWEAARDEGAVSFFEDGLLKVREGNVALEELVRVAPQEIDSESVYS